MRHPVIWDARKSDYHETDFKLNTGIENCSHLYRVEWLWHVLRDESLHLEGADSIMLSFSS